MNQEYVHPWDRPVDHADTALATIQTTPEQLLRGVPIGVPKPQAQCTDCGRLLRAGEPVLVYAYRAADATEWDLARCCCRDCRRDRIAVPTLGTSELLVEGKLGTIADVRRQTDQFCLLDIDRIDGSPPTEGTEP